MILNKIKGWWNWNKKLLADDGGWIQWVRLAAQAYSAYASSKAQQKAADRAAEIAQATGDQAAQIQLQMFKESTELQEPFRKAGLRAIERLEGPAMEELQKKEKGILPEFKQLFLEEGSPVLDFQRRELNKTFAAKGLQRSGAAAKAEAGIVASEALRRQDILMKAIGLREGLFTQRLNVMRGLAGMGTDVSAGLGRQAGQTGQGIAQAYLNTGQGLQQAALQKGQVQGAFYSGLGGYPYGNQGLQWPTTQQQSPAALSYSGNYGTGSSYGQRSFGTTIVGGW